MTVSPFASRLQALPNWLACSLSLGAGALVPLTFVVERSGTTLIIDPPEGLFDLG